jgi:hypothetical protein
VPPVSPPPLYRADGVHGCRGRGVDNVPDVGRHRCTEGGVDCCLCHVRCAAPVRRVGPQLDLSALREQFSKFGGSRVETVVAVPRMRAGRTGV